MNAVGVSKVHIVLVLDFGPIAVNSFQIAIKLLVNCRVHNTL